MRETLPIALRLMFGHEGGYSNRATDAGGPTKFGITHKTLAAARGVPSVSTEQVQALTIQEAETIYRKSYWAQSGGDVLPKGVDYAVFDMGVNSGPPRAVKTLQKVLGVLVDGWIGEKTLSAIRDYDGGDEQLIVDFCDARMDFLRSLTSRKTGWPVNGRGWTIRVTGHDPEGQWKDQPGVLGNALKMVDGRVDPIADVPDEAPEGGDAKAEPKPKQPWLDPGVILPGAGGLLGGMGALTSGTGPVQIALALAIVAAVVVGLFFVVKQLKANPK